MLTFLMTVALLLQTAQKPPEILRPDGLTEQAAAARVAQAETCRPRRGEARDFSSASHRPGIYVASANLPRVAWDPRLEACAVRDPRTAGANIVVPWSKVEPSPGVYDWSYVEEQTKPWRERGQRVNLLFWGSAQRSFQHIEGEPATPAHILAETPAVLCQRTDDNGRSYTDPFDFPVPVHYAESYRQPYLRAVEAFVRRFEAEPWVNYLRAGIGVGAESYPANRANSRNGQCRDEWEEAGFTPRIWREHVLFMVNAFGAMEPRKDLVVTLNDIDGIKGLADEVAALAVETYGFGIGTQGATARAIRQYADTDRDRRCYANWCVLFERYKDAGVPLEIQTPSASNPDGLTDEWSGRTGPLPPILDFALERGATSIEIYPQEWFIANDNARAFRAHRKAYDRALSRTADKLDRRASP